MKTYSFLCAIGFALSACSLSNSSQSVEQDTDLAAQAYRFRFLTVNVTGPVWSFERSGQFLNYGGPVGLIHHNEKHDVIAVDGVRMNLRSAADVEQLPVLKIGELISDAESFCEKTGRTLTHAEVVGLYSHLGQLYITGACADM